MPLSSQAMRLLAFLLLAASLALPPSEARARDICQYPRTETLLIAPELAGARLALVPRGPVRNLPPTGVRENRPVVLQDHHLIADWDDGAQLNIFSGCEPRECLLAPDYGKRRPLRIPVFFIGRPNQSYTELASDVDRIELGPSLPLRRFVDFERVRFTLESGPGYLDRFRPFFQCGFPGLVICARNCPEPLGPLRLNIINNALSGRDYQPPIAAPDGFIPFDPPSRSAPPPDRRAERQPAEPAPQPPRAESAPQPSDRTPERPAPRAQAPEPSPARPPQTQPARPDTAAGTPATQSLRVRVRDEPPAGGGDAPLATNIEILAQASCETGSRLDYTALPSGEGSVPFNRAEAQRLMRVCLILKRDTPLGRACANWSLGGEPLEVPLTAFSEAQCSGRQRLTIAARTETGALINAETILAVEPGLALRGSALSASGGDLIADVPVRTFLDVVSGNGLTNLFSQHRLTGQAFEDGKLLVTLSPQYVRASDVAVQVTDGRQMPVTGCDLRLEVEPGKRIGPGWTQERLDRGLQAEAVARAYRIAVPAAAERAGVFISTRDDGTAATLASSPVCKLAEPPAVTAAELRSLTIARTLKPSGPLLLAVVSPDDRLQQTLPADIEAFWNSALDFVEAVSRAAYDRRILAVTQSPGIVTTTDVWESHTAGPLLQSPDDKARRVATLAERSRPPLPAIKIYRAIERPQLRQALITIRQSAGIRASQTAGQEHLLLVSGAVAADRSEFCDEAARGRIADGLPWGDQVRRTLIVELWSDATVSATGSGAEAVNGVANLYRCRIGGALGEQVKLFGIKVPAGGEPAARDEVFNALRSEAERFLAPGS